MTPADLRLPDKSAGVTGVGSSDLLGVRFCDVFPFSITTNLDGSKILDLSGRTKIKLSPSDAKFMADRLTNSTGHQYEDSACRGPLLHVSARNGALVPTRRAKLVAAPKA